MKSSTVKTVMSTIVLSLLIASAFGVETYAEAIKNARTQMRKRDYASARQSLTKGLQLANLTQVQQFNLKMDYARSYDKEKDYKTAIAEFEKILLLPKLTSSQRVQALTCLACAATVIMDTVKQKNAILAIQKLPVSSNTIKALATISLKMARNDFPSSDRMMRDLLKRVERNNKLKLLTLQHLLNIYFRRSTYKKCRPIMVEYLKLAKTKNLKPYVWTLNQFATRAVYASDYKIAEECFRQVIAMAPLHPHYPGAYFGAAEMAMARGDKATAKIDLLKVINHKKYKASLRYIARIMELAIESGTPERFRKNIATVDKEFAAEKFSEEQRFKLLRKASENLFIAYYYDYVKALEAETKAMMRTRKKKTFVCRYVKNAPRSADAWARSALLNDSRYRESRFNRYVNLNDNLKSDLAYLKSSKAPVKESMKKGYDTSVYVVYDERGVHIFANCATPEAREIERGFAKGGELELYIQPGKNHAYHQWFFTLPGTDESNLVDWDSPNKHYRYTYDYLTKDASVSDTAVGAYSFIPWLMVYDKMPTNSNKWIFSMQRWTKGGSVTLGGAVHELGRAVNLEFAMSNTRLLSIKREIIHRAFAKYKKEREKREGVSIWSDPALGDVEFYQSALKPLLVKLDKSGESVNDKMTDSDVELLFTQFVPKWLELKYEVAELREKYLKNKLFEQEGKK